MRHTTSIHAFGMEGTLTSVNTWVLDEVGQNKADILVGFNGRDGGVTRPGLPLPIDRLVIRPRGYHLSAGSAFFPQIHIFYHVGGGIRVLLDECV